MTAGHLFVKKTPSYWSRNSHYNPAMKDRPFKVCNGVPVPIGQRRLGNRKPAQKQTCSRKRVLRIADNLRHIHWRQFIMAFFYYEGPCYYHSLTLNPAWMRYHMSNKVWDKLTYPFPNFNDGIFDVWEWISNLTITLWCMWLLIHDMIKVVPC